MNVIAVTACPTGIAHSQMAAENLETEADARGHEISVEIEGAMGTENELSEAQIASADVVVIAADTTVHTDRFGDLPIVKGTVKDAVSRADELLDEAESEAGAATPDEPSTTSADAGDASAAGSEESGTAGGEGSETVRSEESETAGSERSETAESGGSSTAEGERASADEGDRSEDRGERGGLVAKLKSLFS